MSENASAVFHDDADGGAGGEGIRQAQVFPGRDIDIVCRAAHRVAGDGPAADRQRVGRHRRVIIHIVGINAAAAFTRAVAADRTAFDDGAALIRKGKCAALSAGCVAADRPALHSEGKIIVTRSIRGIDRPAVLSGFVVAERAAFHDEFRIGIGIDRPAAAGRGCVTADFSVFQGKGSITGRSPQIHRAAVRGRIP